MPTNKQEKGKRKVKYHQLSNLPNLYDDLMPNDDSMNVDEIIEESRKNLNRKDTDFVDMSVRVINEINRRI